MTSSALRNQDIRSRIARKRLNLLFKISLSQSRKSIKKLQAQVEDDRNNVFAENRLARSHGLAKEAKEDGNQIKAEYCKRSTKLRDKKASKPSPLLKFGFKKIKKS